ncbi:MAG: T9SS type B sorting domain-containing protein [Chitinophagaceae bacterium]|nr:MAG: T9SS type B sorting domain-containing protein [Chitinophagaceae bacterium]
MRERCKLLIIFLFPMLRNTGNQTASPAALLRFCLLLLLCSAGVLPTLGQVNLNAGLVASYPFNGNASDASGGGHHAVVNGGAVLGPDRFGNPNSAYVLDGVNDYLAVTDDGAFSTPAMSVSIWFYTERDDRLQMAVAKRAFDASNVSEFGLNVQAGPAVRTFIVRNNRPCADPVGNFDFQSTAIPYATFCKFKWYHVVVSFSNGVEKIYVDGQLLSTATASFLQRSNCLSQLRFGVWWSGDPNWFQGKIDDIRWYNRALTDAEVQALYQSPLPPPPQPNCPTCILPQATLSAASTCAGRPVAIPFQATAGTAPFTVQLSDGTTSFTQSIAGNSGQIMVSPTATTTYTIVSIKDATSCERSSGFSTAGVTVTVLPRPLITVTPQSATVVSGTSVSLTATGGNSYIWTPATGLSNPAIANPVATPATSMVYQVVVTDAQGCKDSANASITVTPPPPSIASFAGPDTVCVNTPITLTNTSVNASTYLWNFCVANSTSTPVGNNLGNQGYSLPVFMDYAKEGNNYYAFVTNNDPASVVRLDFGNSLLNTPTATNLGTFGGIVPYQAEGIQLVFNENRWYAIIVGGSGANSRILRLDFGASLANTPVATNWGNVGNLQYPTDLHIFQSGANWYGLTLNAQSSTITRFDFGTSFNNVPTGVNLGNIGGLNVPTGIYAVANNGNWYAFVSNAGSIFSGSTAASLTRLNFGNSLLNTPTGVNLGNPGNVLQSARDLTIYTSCSEIVGYAVNYSGTNDIVKIDFRNSITSVPTLTSLGNVGALSFPHSISRLFRAGSDLYSFVLNVNSNSLTRLRFVGCSNASIANSTLATPPPFSYNAPGTYSINLTTDEGLSTQSTFCKQIVVVSGQIHTYAKSFCAGDSARLESPMASGNTWSTGGNGSIIYATAPGTYWVRYTNGACTSTDTFHVTQLAKPVIVLNGGGTICVGDSLQFSASGGTQYAWSPAASLTNASIGNPKAGPLTNTTYQVVISNATGCKDSASLTVTVHPRPTLSLIPATATICRGDSVQLSASGGNSYQWSPATGLSQAGIANPKASPATTTTYKVVTANAQGCKDSALITLTVNPRPTLALLPAAPSFCPGDSAQLTASGAATYLWSPAAGLSASNVANPKAAPAATTLYQVVGSTALGCKDSTTITVTRKVAPNLIVSGGGSICAGDSAQLTASGGASYLWSPAATLSSATSANPKAGPQSSTQYQAIATAANGCTDTAHLTVTVNARPVLGVAPSAPAICRFDSVQLSVSGGSTYQWSPAAGLSNPAIANPKASPAATTAYKVLVTNAAGCKDSVTVTVTVYAKPVVLLTPAAPSFCPGDSVQLSATGGATYSWSPAAGLGSAAVAAPKAAPAASTTYTVTVTNAEGCQSTGSLTVTRKNAPVPTAAVSGPICAGDSAQLTAGGGIQYLWSPAGSLSSATIFNPKAGPAANTTYQVVVTNAEGCKDSTQVNVVVHPKPVISIAPAAATLCRGDSLQLQAAGGSNYLWSPATGLDHNDIANPKAGPQASTSYHLVVTGTSGCKDSTDYPITVWAKPLINLTPPASICPGDSLQLSAQGGGTYAWNPASGLSNAGISNPKAAPAATTDYEVIVASPEGCVDSAMMTLTVRPKPLITHTPNSTICAGDSLQLNASGGATYAWSPAASLSDASLPNPMAGPSAPVTYQVVVTGANSCKDSATIDVQVNPKPVLTLTANSSSCRGDSLQLNAGGGGTYQWSPATGLSNAGIAAPKAAPAATTTYSVLVTNASGCQDSKSMTLTVNDKPVITVTPTSRLCNGDTLLLNASGGTAYQWSPAASLLNAGTASPLAFPQDTTRYTVVVRNAAGCVDSAFTQVNVFRLPLLFQQHDTVLCPGQTYLVNAAALPGSTSWLWQNGSTAPTFLIDTPGVYWVHTQVTGCHNPIRDSIFVDTLGLPAVSLGPDRDICAYDNFFLSFQGRNIASFVWSTGSTDPSIRISTTGTYSIDVRNSCGTAGDETDILVLPCNDDLYFPGAFTPNGDGKNDRFKAAHLPGVTVFAYELNVYNRWGELVFRTNRLDEGWDGRLSGKQQDSNLFVWYARYRKNAAAPEQFQKGSVLLIR